MHDIHSTWLRMVEREWILQATRDPLRATRGPLSGLGAQLLVLVALAETVGLGRAGWAVGLSSGLFLDFALARALWRDPASRLGPADWVTLTRAAFAVGVAALAADSLGRDISIAALVSLASAAITLDYVDGWIARHTGTASVLGARLDGEVDAFLILALSVTVAPSAGAWVVAIGAARYAFYAAGWSFAWMRAPLPRRDWRKTVTASQGVALTLAAAEILPLPATRAILAVALALLAESFGRDVWWLWRHRRHADVRTAAARNPDRGAGVVLTTLAVAVVWVALVAPVQPWRLTPGSFVRLPLEGIVALTLVLLVPRRAGRVVPWLAGLALGLLVLVKVLDLGFFTAFDRPFNPVDDWSLGAIGVETVRNTFGRTVADLVAVGAALLAVAALVLPTLAALRLARFTSRHRRSSLWTLGVLTAAWAACCASGAVVAGTSVASTSAAHLAAGEVRAVRAGLADRAHFNSAIQDDRYRGVRAARLLSGLSGKDVLLVFVESYGKLAVEGSPFSPAVDAVLASGDQQLARAGFSAQSGWLTSPTFGGGSWWAHATLQSGTWIDTQGRYDDLVKSDRVTLASTFAGAGWRTVADDPSNNRAWPEGTSFYHYSQIYDRRNVGYHGPTYGFSSMPDQYTLLALQQLELGKPHRRPIFSEIDLTSSHTPWTRIPSFIPWSRVGNGSIFNRQPANRSGLTDTQQGYSTSIEYALRTLFSFVAHYGNKNTVLIVLGDHQPSRVVTGDPGHDVPVSIIAHDPAVLQQIASWGWANGMRPTDTAPVWLMSDFRDRFFSAFGS
ncbi:MAG: CDP-alcohol phosphatidyltransferase family protein [Gaiellaceae bacterium]